MGTLQDEMLEAEEAIERAAFGDLSMIKLVGGDDPKSEQEWGRRAGSWMRPMRPGYGSLRRVGAGACGWLGTY